MTTATAPKTINGQPLRTVFTGNWERMKQERSSVLEHCREINTLFMPRSGRFFEEKPNARAGKRNTGIYDNTATRSARTTAASLQSTTSSPARPWFRLATGDTELDQAHAVKVWFDAARAELLSMFQAAGVYQALHQLYLELVLYGTAAALMLEDDAKGMRLKPLTFGEYCVDVGPDDRVDTLYRVFRMTTGQLMKRFPDTCSDAVKSEFKNNQTQNWHDVLHVIEPRDRYDPGSESPLDRRWRSVYVELTADESHQMLLDESGYERFPVIAVRWDVQGADAYGTSPAMDCLGDVQSLQQAQFRLHQAVDYKTKPPMQLPTSMRGQELNTQPGAKNFVSGTTPAQPLWVATLETREMREVILDIQARINSAMFTDVFLSLLSSNDTTQRTAEEIRERRDEKFQLLGPVSDRLSDECHEPLIVFGFYRLMALNRLPPLPPELSGSAIQVEFISVLAQAQKAIQTVATDRIIGTVMAVAQHRPDIWDKLDVYYLVDHLVDRYGGDPKLAVSTDDAVKVAEGRNAALKAKEQGMLAEQASKTAANLSTITPTDAVGMFAGGLGEGAGP